MKMEESESSETSEYKIQAAGNYPEEGIQHSEHGESLKSRIVIPIHADSFKFFCHFYPTRNCVISLDSEHPRSHNTSLSFYCWNCVKSDHFVISPICGIESRDDKCKINSNILWNFSIGRNKKATQLPRRLGNS
jgi:hypothetical protein